MRTVFYSWRFPEVVRSTVSAERRSAAAELRQLRRHLHNARQIVEAALGAGSVLKDSPAGEATASSDRLATVRGLADRLVLTEIDRDFAGDAHFPEFDRAAWQEVARDARVSESGLPFAFVRYERSPAD